MNRKSLLQFLFSCLALMAAWIAPPPVAACTRVLWNENKLAVLVGRTMDWPESTEPIIYVFPRGLKRDGGRAFSNAWIVHRLPQKRTADFLAMSRRAPAASGLAWATRWRSPWRAGMCCFSCAPVANRNSAFI